MNNKYMEILLKRFPELKDYHENIFDAFNIIREAYENDRTLFVCGNGGSASDAEHIVGELMKGFKLPRKINETPLKEKAESYFGEDGKILINNLQNGLRAISLMSHPSLISAYANDVNAEMIFAQQLFVLSRQGDVLFAITTSGNSKNVLRAIQAAKIKGIKIILLTGSNGGKCAQISDCIIRVPSDETYIIQEYHLPIYHTLALMLEDYFYGSE